jgi:hypothetical protein
LPQNYTLSSDAYFDLQFSHSALLDFEQSSLTVRLNGEPIGSARLNEETASQGKIKIFLPASATRSGPNQLSVDIDLVARNECVDPRLEGLWMRIDSNSLLHLPLVPGAISGSLLLDLSRYPAPIVLHPLLSDLAFVLAPNDPAGWNVAAQIAFTLGNTYSIPLADLKVVYGDAVSDEVRQTRNLLIVGRPSQLPVVAELAEALPAPFAAGSDLALEKNLQVTYHLEPGVDIGYLELIPAPWNNLRTILLVSGSSDQGVQWAGQALQLGRLRSRLSGNLAFINGEQVVSADTRILQGVSGVLATVAPVEGTPVAIEPFVAQRPAWILPTLLVSVGGMVLVAFILALLAIQRRRTGQKE